MRRKKTYFRYFVFLFTLLNIILSNNLQAQAPLNNDNLGVSWNPPENPTQISSDLDLYREIGITFIELKHPVNKSILDSLSNYRFTVIVRFPQKFLTTSYVKENTDWLISEYSSGITEYSDYNFITAFGLYSNSQSSDSKFISEFENIKTELKNGTEPSFYEVSTTFNSNLIRTIIEVNNETILNPDYQGSFILAKPFVKTDFLILTTLLDDFENLVFLDSYWLKDALQNYLPLKKAFLDYKEIGIFILPLPNNESSSAPFNWPVFVFVLIWISAGIHVFVSGTYKPLITRFFTGHRFFVDDIMRYRERSSVSGIFLFFQHALFTGLVVYIISNLLISETGLQAFYHSIPQAGIFGQNYFSLFVMGVALACLVQLIGLAWLYFPSDSMTHFSQAMTLYTWIFHVDFVLVSLMLVLFLSGGSQLLILFLSILFILTWLAGFFLTAFDSSKYLMQKRIKYMLYTFGLHSFVNILILVLILINETLLDFLELITTI